MGGEILGMLVVVLYLGLIIYFIVLATRFVGAMERIATSSERFVSQERKRRNELGAPPASPQQ